MDYLGEIESLKNQLSFSETIKDTDYDQIVIAGMGGSGIAGKIFQELYTEKPVRLVEDYRIPKFVNKNTLFIAVSYSGTTEETLSAATQAKRQGAHLVTISSGQQLSKLGHQNIILPNSSLQPRAAVGYLLVPLLRSFKISTERELNLAYRSIAGLDKNSEECKKHAAKISAEKKIPVIYSGAPFKSVAYRWKTQMNENAKVICYANYFPELNHNDTVALAKTYRKDLFYFLVLESDYPEIRKRVELTASITNTEFHVIKAKGKSVTERLFYLIHFGDYLSYHLGKLRGVDPGDVTLVNEIKKGLVKNDYSPQTRL